MSTLRTITAFKSKLSGGGARPNLFEVEIPSFPEAAGTNKKRILLNFYVKLRLYQLLRALQLKYPLEVVF